MTAAPTCVLPTLSAADDRGEARCADRRRGSVFRLRTSRGAPRSVAPTYVWSASPILTDIDILKRHTCRSACRDWHVHASALLATLRGGRSRRELLHDVSRTLPGANRPGGIPRGCAPLVQSANQNSSLSECSLRYGIAAGRYRAKLASCQGRYLPIRRGVGIRAKTRANCQDRRRCGAASPVGAAEPAPG